jgi:hypothetical protein
MTKESIKALTDSELAQVMAWGMEEERSRKAIRRQEAIAKIRELAKQQGVHLTITGIRGRPAALKKNSH